MRTRYAHAGSRTAARRAPRRVIAALFVLALVCLVTTGALTVAARTFRRPLPEQHEDRTAALVALVARTLPLAYRDWGRAMSSELAHVQGARERRSFSFGCVRAAVVIHARAMLARPPRGTGAARATLFAGIVAALALAAYGLARYPGLRSGFDVWASVTVLLALLFGYAVIGLALSSSRSARANVARRSGLAAGLAVGAAWFVILSPTPALKAWVFLPLTLVLLGPGCLAALVGRSTGDARTGTHAALWSGIVGGLLVFAIWVTATYVRDGRPYDPGLIRDFHKSGAHDLATYAVGDNLGSGLVLLILVPLVALALGSLGARLAVSTARRS